MILTGQFYTCPGWPTFHKERMVDKNSKSQQIMQAAERLFTSRRFHEITMEDVAKEAGVGKGTIYRYFQDKDDLFFRIATSGFDELCDLLRRKVPGNASFPEQLLIACRQIGRFFERRRQLSRMMQSEEGRMSWGSGQLHQRWMEHRKRLVAAVADLVQKGVSEGEVREDIPPVVLANFLMGMLRTRGRDMCDVPQAMRQHEVVVELFVRGAGTGRTATAGARGQGPGARNDNGHGLLEDGATSERHGNDHGPATAQDHATRPAEEGATTKVAGKGLSEGKA
jgi:TetR/AcrR family fatty acid metabolism transcriptional regulator